MHINTDTVLPHLAPQHPGSKPQIPQPRLLHITMDKTPYDPLHLPFFGHTARLPPNSQRPLPNLNPPLQNPTRHQGIPVPDAIGDSTSLSDPPTPHPPLVQERRYTCTSLPECLVSPSSSLLPQSQSSILTIACSLQRGKVYFPCLQDVLRLDGPKRGGRGA
jgi:hypothetical protein